MGEFEQMVMAARTDEGLFEELVESHRLWILHIVSEVSHRYVTDSDDEWSVALAAFHEAVSSYDESRGSFRGLAAMVIRRRIVDYYRSEGRHSDELSVTPAAFGDGLDEDEATGINLQVQRRVSNEANVIHGMDTAILAREEIAEIQEVLDLYGISFFDLADASPKAEKTKKSCAKAVRTLIASVILMAEMRLKRLLPVKALSAASGVIRKILERHRKYIIASAEILDGDFPILSGYLKYIRER